MHICIFICNIDFGAAEWLVQDKKDKLKGAPLAVLASPSSIQPIALPILAPDETAFSLLARARCVGGYQSSTAASRIMLGDARAGLLFDFPRCLAELSRHMPGRLSDPVTLANKATGLPFYTRFRHRPVAERAIQKMCGPSVAGLKDDLGLRASAVGALLTVKACPACIIEDAAAYGVAYWHRTLQLPGVTVCPVHHIPLIESATVRQGKQRGFFLPHELTWTHNTGQQRHPRSPRRALRLANLAAAALSSSLPGGFNAETLYFTYRHGLKAGGFLSQGGRLRLASLKRHLQAHIENLPDTVRLCRPELSRETDALFNILRARHQTYNTLPHLVLIDFLFESWDHFASTYGWECTLCLEPDVRVGSTPLHNSLVNRRGCLSTQRSDANWDRCTAAVLRYISERPGVTRSQLVKACGGPWRWLYRNDPGWLDANSPPPLPRGRRYLSWVNWPKRDAVLVGLIEREDRVTSFPKNARITPRTILRRLGPIPFSVQLNKMPKSMAKLAEIAEQIKRRRQ
jgi:TniQ/Tn7-like transposition protein D